MKITSLASLKPQIVDVRIPAYGEEFVIPVMPLTYSQYNNASIGVERPSADDYKIRKLNAAGKMEDAIDYNNPEFLREMSIYNETVSMRRLALALAGGGLEELQGKTLDEQVEIVRGMDAGITGALMRYLEREARQKLASTFHPLRENGSEATDQTG